MSRHAARSITIATVVGVVLLSLGVVAQADHPTNSWAQVVRLTPAFPPVPGSSSVLHRRETFVTMQIASSGFAPDSVVTAWWIIFNNPTNCTHPVPALNAMCGAADISNPATGTTYQWADGQVVHDDGEVALKGSLSVGDVTQCAAPSLPCVGLLNVNGAEYHIALRSMGPVVPSLLSQQLTLLNGGCGVGQPNAGLCANVQGAIHLSQ